MALKDFEFKGSYSKLIDDIADDFYIPCMSNSVEYKRISGYFGSTIYIIAWSALKHFVQSNGHIRILCSPYLTDEDAQAIKNGFEAKTDNTLAESLKRELDEMLENDSISLAARLLTCLIANNIIEIKLVIARNELISDPRIERLFHDKVGTFIDEDGNSVAFRGSINETFKGLSNDGNIESIDVFQSWDEGKDLIRLKEINEGFDLIWSGYYDFLDLYDLPPETKKYIGEKSNDYHWQELLKEVEISIDKAEKWKPNKQNNIIKLKKHQVNALEKWEQSGYHAIYQGCTGCGKTVIAISAIRHELLRGKKVLILVPSKELLDNWEKEIRRILSDININIFLCGDGNTSWKNNGNLSLWTSPRVDISNIIISTMDTASTDSFINMVNDGEHLFVVADEVHRIGSPFHRKALSIKYGSALGLSATPKRYGDPDGTNAIIEYFGEILQPPYTLQDALKDEVLTKYFYYPRTVSLTKEEQEEWDELTKKISMRYAISNSNDASFAKDDPFMQNMMIQRARILKKAKNKVRFALDVIKNNYKDGQKWLVYCEDKKQLNEVLSSIRKESIDAYAYYADMPGDRDNTLRYFEENGGVIVSIKCLDEGVDIPSTTHALILASSKNPREFIQRRGRILRKDPSKNISFLYDAIVVPSETNIDKDKSVSIVVSELARAIEFGNNSISAACITDLKIIAHRFGVNYEDLVEEGYEEDEE